MVQIAWDSSISFQLSIRHSKPLFHKTLTTGYIYIIKHTNFLVLKGCICYIFALFFKSKWEHLENQFISFQKLFLFSRKSNFRIFQISCHHMTKHKARNIFYWIIWEIKIVCQSNFPVYVNNFIKFFYKNCDLKTSS